MTKIAFDGHSILISALSSDEKAATTNVFELERFRFYGIVISHQAVRVVAISQNFTLGFRSSHN